MPVPVHSATGIRSHCNTIPGILDIDLDGEGLVLYTMKSGKDEPGLSRAGNRCAGPRVPDPRRKNSRSFFSGYSYFFLNMIVYASKIIEKGDSIWQKAKTKSSLIRKRSRKRLSKKKGSLKRKNQEKRK
jgi:hypothetical protein